MSSSSSKAMGDSKLSPDKEDDPGAVHRITSHDQGETEPTAAKTLDENVVDEAAKYLASTRDGQYAPLTPEMEKKLRKKIDSWMIPLVRVPTVCFYPAY